MSIADWKAQNPVPAPANFDINGLFAGISWHQSWEIFRGIYTPGRNPVAELCDYIQLPADLRGKRVLDIGPWHGCFSFECERRGAAEVVAYGPDNPKDTGFDRIKEAIGSKVVRYEIGSVYDLDPAKHGTYDLVLFLGILYHLRYPLLAIDKIRRIARGAVLLESHVIDNCLIGIGEDPSQPVPLKNISPDLVKIPLWQFYRHSELGGDYSNWFGPNIKAVTEAFGSSGFDVATLSTWGSRAAFRATPIEGIPEFLSQPTYDAMSAVIRRSVGL